MVDENFARGSRTHSGCKNSSFCPPISVISNLVRSASLRNIALKNVFIRIIFRGNRRKVVPSKEVGRRALGCPGDELR
jgi:hypothetical protein